MENWPAIELPLPASTVEELLKALILRDLVHGSSYDVEVEETGDEFQVDLIATDELDEEQGVYTALIEVEAGGQVNEDSLSSFLTQMIDELMGEAEEMAEAREEIGVFEASELEFRIVSENEERWDLVIPDWLAPEDAIVPFGFRSCLRKDGEPFPSDSDLDDAGRVVLVPMGKNIHVLAIPAPKEDTGNLPLHPET